MPDRSKFMFNGKPYGKGHVVLEVVRKYVEQHPDVSFEALRQIFPDDLQKAKSPTQFSSYGRCVIRRLNDVAEEKRFHMKAEDQIGVRSKAVVVSREWNVHNFRKFLEEAQKLGLKIEKITYGTS